MTDASAAGQGAMIHISAVLPTLNEAKNIGYVLQAMPTYLDEVIIVDGQSLDGTVEAARAVRPDVRVVRQVPAGCGTPEVRRGGCPPQDVWSLAAGGPEPPPGNAGQAGDPLPG